MKHFVISLCIAWTLVFGGSPVAAEQQGQKAEVSLGPAQYYWLLNRACYYGDDIGASMLLDAGADVNGVKDYAQFVKAGFGIEPSWPINQASWGGHKEVVKLLLKRSANVDSEESEGYTALLIATMKGNADLVDILLKAGADRSYKGPEGTALDVARSKKFSKIVALLTS